MQFTRQARTFLFLGTCDGVQIALQAGLVTLNLLCHLVDRLAQIFDFVDAADGSAGRCEVALADSARAVTQQAQRPYDKQQPKQQREERHGLPR